jgi:hypothetical protein
MARLNRDIVVTEKIDGTNAQIFIDSANEIGPEGLDPTSPEAQFQTEYALGFKDGMAIYAGSRTRWIKLGDDNFAFAKWVSENADELFALGAGSHFGEWWGNGIQRGYGMSTRKFSLFNTNRWYDSLNHQKLCPPCCDVVPILYAGPFDQRYINNAIDNLSDGGSDAALGFMDPEGVVVFHTAANQCFKITCHNDEKPKGQQ